MLINVSRITREIKLLSIALRHYRLRFLAILGLGLLSGFFESFGIAAVIPLFYLMVGQISEKTDAISQAISKIFHTLGIPLTPPVILLLILGLFLAKAVIYVIARYYTAKISSRYEEDIRRDFFGRTIHANWSYILDHKSGELGNSITYDVERSAYSLILVSGSILTLTSFLMYAAVAFSISAWVTLVTIAIGGLLFLIFKPIFYRIRKLLQEAVQIQKEVSHHIAESMSGAKAIKAASVEDAVLKKGYKNFSDLRKAKLRAAFYRQSTLNFIEPIGFTVIAVLFVTSYHSPSFNIATFAVVMYLIQRMFSFIETTQSQLHSINEAIPYVKSVLDYKQTVSQYKEKNTGTAHFSLKQELRFKNVGFRYADNSQDVLTDIDFTVKKGQMVGIIGASGVGKTTIVDLLLRLFTPKSGKILSDDRNISGISLDEWRKNIGYVSQDIFLVNDTIKNNIRFYDDSVSEYDIVRAAKMANIYDVITAMPEQFETVIGERGVKLSGGQRQRIVLARALARNPQILILDEATSAVDAESEQLIQQSLQELRGKMTIIIIAHRPSTIMHTDNLFVLQNGRIVEDGSPQELKEREDSYLSRLLELK